MLLSLRLWFLRLHLRLVIDEHARTLAEYENGAFDDPPLARAYLRQLSQKAGRLQRRIHFLNGLKGNQS